MGNRIVYFTNGYLPDREGVSKEILTLYSHFNNRYPGKVYLHNLADRWQFSLRGGFVSYPDMLLPIGYPVLKYLEKTANIAHIYGSLTGRIYLKLIKKRPCILTSASALITERLEECAPSWNSIDMIVLESEQDRLTLLEMGVDSQKIFLVYPGVPTHDMQPPPMDAPFTILFASAPIEKDPNSLYRRGVGLLIQTAKRLRDCRFIFLWRGKHTKMLQQMIAEAGTNNIKVIDRIIPNLAVVLESVHCTILSPESWGECKPCPNSLIESLACGRPVLASKVVGISNVIEQEKCGVAFTPDPDEIEKAIHKLQNNYEDYKSNALHVALKYFSTAKFISAYESLYKKMGITY
jgi:glycosyltransferase involved in cell wall biosynthesis